MGIVLRLLLQTGSSSWGLLAGLGLLLRLEHLYF